MLPYIDEQDFSECESSRPGCIIDPHTGTQAGKQARGKSGLCRVWTRRGAERRSEAGRRPPPPPPPPPPPRPLCRASKISRGRVGLLGQAACAAGMRSDHSSRWGRALALGGSQAASGSAGRVPGRSSQAHRRPPWPTTPPASSGTNRPLGLI